MAWIDYLAEIEDFANGILQGRPHNVDVNECLLGHLIAEAERLQMLISSYLAQVHADLDEAPQLRRAAAAYTRAEGIA